MSGAYRCCTMDLMSAYYHVRMREEYIKFIANNASVDIGNVRNLKDTKFFYNDIYIFMKSPKIEDHLKALCETLRILRENKLYVKISTCGYCAQEIKCIGGFEGRN
ncbi:polyprotein [Phytophthora megakarya]|uniref:Polyprotein n=1 Tax=Phytophthora megakarya TaxID=4795 RepID=A0A225X0K2_9STRA|nr:polyprotein [Phytophthora megakarya]